MKSLKFFGLLVLIACLPGCMPDWLKEKLGMECQPSQMVQKAAQRPSMVDDGSPILVSMNGKSIITEKSLDHEFNQLLEESPQLRQVLPLMPDAKKNFLQGMISTEVVDRWIEERGIDKTAGYQKELQRMTRSVERMLNTKFFTKEHPVKISEREAKKFYEENKDKIPELLISRGGVQTVGVSFEKEAAAKKFLAAARGDVAKTAEAQGLKAKVRDFNLVNAQSVGINPAIRNRIVALKSFPATEVMKENDKTFWVIQATSREDAKYRSFEQVKNGIIQLVENQQQRQKIEEEINRLKKQYKVVVNEEHFKKQAPMQPGLPQRLDVNQVRVAEQKKQENQAPVPTARAV